MIYDQPQEVENGVSFAVIGDQGEEITVMPHGVEWLSTTYVRFVGSEENLYQGLADYI